MEQHCAAFEELAIRRHLLSGRYETSELLIGDSYENESWSEANTELY